MQSSRVLDVERAEARIRPYLAPSPLAWCEQVGAWLKLESLQVTGSYKVRGALNALLARVEAGERRPVVAASAGNHARGVAWAARQLGLRALVVMPTDAPRTKIAGATALGAEVVLHGDCFEDAEERARALAETHGGWLLSAFDDAHVIAGQGTVGLELLPLAPDVVLVPIGGGGLASGVGLALRAHGVRVVGVQVEGVDAMARVLSGRPALTELAHTIADGVRVREPGQLTRRICASVLDEVVLVTEAEVRRAVVDLAQGARVVAEGAGALAVAALPKVRGARKVAVISGGNIDLSRLGALLSARSVGAPLPPFAAPASSHGSRSLEGTLTC